MNETVSPRATTPIDETRRARVERLLAEMTLPEKVGQLTQVEFGSVTPDEVAAFGIGSVLSGGGGNHGDGRAADWRDGVAAYVDASTRSRLGIPILYGTDAVHGHNNVRGATIFPHNIGLGAAGDVDLVRRIGRAAALETAATGARWSFSPCLAVPRDPRWGRTYEGFSEDPAVVADLGQAMVTGWHGRSLDHDGVLACPKHFAGEGAMVWGTAGRDRHPWIEWWDGWGPTWQIDQGDITLDEAEFRASHLAPFAAAVDAGALTVMACYATWNGLALHAHHHLLTDVLKGELGFAGFVVSDWMAIDQVDDDYATAVERCVTAGLDMVMVPFEFRRFLDVMIDLVESGRVSPERLDDAVQRILTVKAAVGLFDDDERPLPPLAVVGAAEHRALARDAVAASAVILVDNGSLPIAPDESVLTSGPALDDIGLACGGWSISWQGNEGPITDGHTMLDGLRSVLGDRVTHDRDGHHGECRADVGVVAVHEPPYVEGGGDRADLRLPSDDVDLVRRMRAQVDRLIVLVVSGRPIVIDEIVDEADTIIACWLPGSEAIGVSDVLTGLVPPRGRLPVRWPRDPDHVGPEAIGLADPPPWPVGHAAHHAHNDSKEMS